MKLVTKQTFRLFWRHAKPYKKLMTLMTVTLAAGMALETAAPLFYKRFFDVLSSAQSFSRTELSATLIRIVILILFLYLIEWICWRVATFANNYFQPRVMSDILNSSFEYLHGHSYGFFVNRFVGALVRKVNRLVDAFEGISDRLYWDLLPMAIRIIAILIVLWNRSITVALVLIGWIVLYLAVNYGFTVFKLKYDVESATVDSRVTAHLGDTITNNVNIKLFTSLASEQRSFKRITGEQFKIRKFVWDLNAFLESIQALFMIILEYALFRISIRYWVSGVFSIGDFVLLQAYLLQIFNRLWDFGRIIRDIYRRLADAEEMVEILYTPHAVQDAGGAKKLMVKLGEVDFRNVSFAYTWARNVLHDFSLLIRPGEKVGLVGPSGAGKSTVTALLFRFYDVTNGGIYIDGINIKNATQRSLRDQISLVPQDPILFHRTLMENIRYGRLDASDAEVLRAAGLAHCDEFITRMPEGYDTYVGERGIKLSGGERQRVAIARAILKNAPILVLDEATSSLDSHSESLIQDALERLMAHKTVMVIAHRLSTIMKMDRIIVVREGRITEQGTHDTLLQKRGGLYRMLWRLQAGGFIQ
ncbi:MAG: ABC transporter ATP-binding protein [Patescibacteria group bacterium]